MTQVKIPQPKFGWSERIAQELEDRMTKINETVIEVDENSFKQANPTMWISPFKVPQVDDPPELEANDSARQNAVEKYPLSPIDDMQKLMADNRPHSPWVAWALKEMTVKGIKRCTPYNMLREGQVEFGLVALG